MANQTFGYHLRTGPLGFAWHFAHQAYIRIQAGGPPRRVTICSPDAVLR